MSARVFRTAWAPWLLAVAWLAATIWARPLALPDEGRYVGVAWGMLQSGDWLTPHLNGLPYFHKPPLFYWITAAAMSLFGPHEWAARLAPLAGGILGISAVYLFARRWFSEREGRLALVALATQPMFFVGSQYANLDMLVAGCIGACIAAFAHAALVLHEGGHPRRALALGYLFMALGVLAKGLIGIVLPGMVLVFWLLAWRQWRLIFKLLWLPGFVLFFVVAGPWFVAMQERFPEFSYYFFVVQHFARYATSGFNNQQPLWFYPVVLGVLALPWSMWAFSGRWRGALADPQRGHLRLLLWVWLAVLLGFFSLPESKLVGYIFPATLPLALMAADAIGSRPLSARIERAWKACAVVVATVCVVAVAGFAIKAPKSLQTLGQAIASRAQPGDRVVFLQGYYFDIPFYARLHGPAIVVDDWELPDPENRDNWRKELADAARFDPAPAQRTLLTPAQLPEVYCDSVATWLIGGPWLPARYTLLQGAELVKQAGHTVLWRVPGLPPGVKRAGCPGTPIASSADK